MRICTFCSAVNDKYGGLCGECTVAHDNERRAAVGKVGRAVAKGLLTRAAGQTCVDCGKDAVDLDHRDYTKPLEVEPVCRRCNLVRGYAFNSFYRPGHVGGDTHFPQPAER